MSTKCERNNYCVYLKSSQTHYNKLGLGVYILFQKIISTAITEEGTKPVFTKVRKKHILGKGIQGTRGIY